jgi:hypothetical protein
VIKELLVNFLFHINKKFILTFRNQKHLNVKSECVKCLLSSSCDSSLLCSLKTCKSNFSFSWEFYWNWFQRMLRALSMTFNLLKKYQLNLNFLLKGLTKNWPQMEFQKKWEYLVFVTKFSTNNLCLIKFDLLKKIHILTTFLGFIK